MQPQLYPTKWRKQKDLNGLGPVPTVEVSWLDEPTAVPAFIRSSSSPTPREFRLRRNRHATKARPPTRTAPPTPTTTPMMIRLDESLRPEEARPPLLSLLRPGAGDWPGVMVEAEVCSKVLPLMVMVLVTMTTEDCVGWGELVRGGGVVRFVVLVGVSELVVLGGGSFVLEVVGFSGSEVVGGSGVELEVEEVVVVVGSSVGDGEAVCDSSTLTLSLSAIIDLAQQRDARRG
ncbi:predicted protein [Histoplasma mississippiense (nom. inval.)]|uniref:predicted protein n=1 Tax=Ajellomyces capsulatus (strain NAm1 / WU24) TaxID=2059318 RepID=UPI000157B9E6|nr:predicted protein [Histoplasma mississippiense (nom. inval.)]EDN04046.1 predicted protein [Histoplasma mississippiense (nom. inval.)]